MTSSNPSLLEKEETAAKFIHIFQKDSRYRTQNEREFVARILSKNSFFEDHIDKEFDMYETALSLVNSFELEYLPPRTPFITYGDLGDKFYILVRGKAFVYLPKSEAELREEKKSQTEKRKYMPPAATVDLKILEEIAQPERRDSRRGSQILQHSIVSPKGAGISIMAKLSLEEAAGDEQLVGTSPIPSGIIENESIMLATPHYKRTQSKNIGHMVQFANANRSSNQRLSRRGSFKNVHPAFESKKSMFGDAFGVKKEKEKTIPANAIKLNITKPELKQYIETDMDLGSPRLQNYLTNTPTDDITYENLLLLTEKKHRKAFIHDGIITMKKTGVMVPGDYFGEKALFGNTMRTATVISNEECWVLTLTREQFRHIFELQHERTKQKEEFLGKVFNKLWTSELKRLILGFTEVKIPLKNHVFFEGDKVDGLYVIKEGEIKLTQKIKYTMEPQKSKAFKLQSNHELTKFPRQAVHTIAVLGPGQLLGHEEIVEKLKERKYTATCVQSDAIVYKMGLKDFRRYIEHCNHPEFIEVLQAAATILHQWRQEREREFCSVQTLSFESPVQKANFPKTRALAKEQHRKETIEMITVMQSLHGEPIIKSKRLEELKLLAYGNVVDVSEAEYSNYHAKKAPVRIFQRHKSHHIRALTEGDELNNEQYTNSYSIKKLPPLKTHRPTPSTVTNKSNLSKRFEFDDTYGLKVKSIKEAATARNIGEKTANDSSIQLASVSITIDNIQSELEKEFTLALKNKFNELMHKKELGELPEPEMKKKNHSKKPSRNVAKSQKFDDSKVFLNRPEALRDYDCLADGLIGKVITSPR